MPARALAGLGVVQAAWAILGGVSPITLGLAIGSAVLSMVVFFLPDRLHHVRLKLMGGLAALAFINIVVFIQVSTDPFSFRLLLLGIVVAYLVVGIAGLTSKVSPLAFDLVLVIGACAVVAMLLAEAVLEARNSSESRPVVQGTLPQPAADGFYTPGSTALSTYPDNPSGYFHRGQSLREFWTTETYTTADTVVLERPENTETLRFRVTAFKDLTPPSIKLVMRNLGVERGETYDLHFRARATVSRWLTYAVSSVNPVWRSVSAYRRVRVDTTWQTFDERFTSPVSDSSALWHFDIGGDSTAVELTGLSLVATNSGRRVEPRESSGFTVSYRFNQEGCRGPEYADSTSSGVQRVLVLGDAYTLGIGVHEDDTYTGQLERLGNGSPSSPKKYEVINCGVVGYGTADARRQLERVGPRYRPQMVIVGVAAGDERRRESDVVEAPTKPVTPFERLSWMYTLAKHRNGGPAAQNDATIVEELRQLDASVRSLGARLMIVLLHDRRESDWAALAESVAEAFDNDGVTVVDLGEIWSSIRMSDRIVHPRLDPHPNASAHRMAAEQILRALRERRDTQASPDSIDSDRAKR